VGSIPYAVAIGDFNGDGKQDFAVVNAGIKHSLDRLGDARAALAAHLMSAWVGSLSVAIGDFNGDGKQDLAVANFNSNIVSIRLGDGLAALAGSTEVSVGSGLIQ